MARLASVERDVLRQPPPREPPWYTSRRIGIHTSTAGGVELAAERAYRLGCNAFQIFSTSPRQWKPYALTVQQAAAMAGLREKYGLTPLVVHANYLINLAAANSEFLRMSVEAFRSELTRSLLLQAEYLVLHPGSFRGMSRQAGLERVAAALALAADGLDLESGKLTVLLENTAGAEFSLGGSFEQLAELRSGLAGIVPVAACIDTCHTHAAGYDIVSEEGFQATLAHLDATIGLPNVRVWHCNDAKTPRGSRLDRHQHVGEGAIGLQPFRRLLNDPRLAHSAFIAETPIDHPGDDRRNVGTLKSLVREARPQKRRSSARKVVKSKAS
ncbi:MAG TPA: deoxyribonuclease IV [Terriglobales bacterium]|nr:deoxyribonuclease IV [Terriglobales bacterium]